MNIVTRSTEVGFELLPMSSQMNLERWVRREEYQQKGNPGFHPAKNIHTDPEVARMEGLKAPVAGIAVLVTLISRMMMAAFGEGWVKGGKISVKLIKPTFPTDFVTAKGFVKEKHPENGGERLVCDVWIEKQNGEKTVVGTASGLVA